MTSSNGSIFRVTGPLWGEFTGHRWIPLTKASNAELWFFIWSAPWINGWANNHENGYLRRHRAPHDVIVMPSMVALGLSVGGYQAWPPIAEQIGFHEAPLCVFLLLEILCSSTKVTLMLNAWCVFHVFGCAYHLSSRWVLVCLLWAYVAMEHMVHSKLFQISTSSTQKYPELALAPVCWVADIILLRLVGLNMG